jgi:hypothetical protein
MSGSLIEEWGLQILVQADSAESQIRRPVLRSPPGEIRMNFAAAFSRRSSPMKELPQAAARPRFSVAR